MMSALRVSVRTTAGSTGSPSARERAGRRGGLSRDTPMTGDETRRRLGVAQVEALFGSILAGDEPSLLRLRHLDGGLRLAWICEVLDRVRLALLHEHRCSMQSHALASTDGRGRSATNGAPGAPAFWGRHAPPAARWIGSRQLFSRRLQSPSAWRIRGKLQREAPLRFSPQAMSVPPPEPPNPRPGR